MAEYGIATWDSSGNYNNFGIVPVSVIDALTLARDQVSGTYYYTVPNGCYISCIQVMMDDRHSVSRRRISVSGGVISISPANQNDFSAGTEPAVSASVIVQVLRG